MSLSCNGSIFRFEGNVTVFGTRKNGPTYAKRHASPSRLPAELAPSCSEAGVLGALPGIVGTLQAPEALKLILGIGDPLIGSGYLAFGRARHDVPGSSRSASDPSNPDRGRTGTRSW